MRKNKEKGFSLIELLITIFIISIILGISTYFTINIINNAKGHSNKISYENIKTSARIYIKENPNKITWGKNQDNTNETYSCIPINALINQGMIKKDKIDNKIKYVKIIKDQYNNIISEKIYKETDTTDECNIQNLKIPTSKEYCKPNLEYNGEEQNLINNLNNELFTFNNHKQTNAGSYTIDINLKDNSYMWNDGTKETKQITCKIKKANPTLNLEPSGSDSAIPETLKTTLTSDVAGTLKIKSSNKDYAIAKITNNNIIKEKEIEIKTLSARTTNTIITITLTPEDPKNYNTSSTIYTIGKINKIEISVPECNNDLYYDGTEKELITNSFEYKLYNNKQTSIGKYTIIAKPKYGYYWKGTNNDTSNKEIYCEIKPNNITIEYNSNGGTVCNPNTKTVTYNKPYNELCLPEKTNYFFQGWYTEPTGGTKITKNSIVKIQNDHKLYARWKKVSCSLTFNGTLGNNNWYTSAVQVNMNINNLNSDEIINKNITTNPKEKFTKLSSTIQKDTNETKWYGYIKDSNNQIISCNKTIKVDTTSPTTPIIKKYVNGKEITSDDWTKNDINLVATTIEEGSGINYWEYNYMSNKNKQITTESKTYNDTITAKIQRNTTYDLKTCDNAGNCSNTNKTNIKIDVTPPTIININNPTNGKITDQAFPLTLEGTDIGSGIKYWQYTYSSNATITGTDNTKTWVTYNNSSSNTFVTTPFTAERNQPVYIRACDYLNNCSGKKSTHIYIAYCNKDNPTACPKFYTCVSANPNKFEIDHTNIRNKASFESTQELTLWTGSLVYKISEEQDEKGRIFYYVYVDDNVSFSTQNKWYNLGRYGYIYKNCLSSIKPSESGNWCTPQQCPSS